MTVIRPNSISGITSLTAHRGSIDFYAHDGSAARFDNINSYVTSGVSTFASLNITGDLDVGGALTYEDVTNIDSVGVITARDAIVISEDNAIHFRGTAADDADAILRASAGGGQLLINSRNDAIINIDSNNDSTDAHFAVAHGAATGSSTELFRVQENGKVGINETSPDSLLHLTNNAGAGIRAGLRLESSGTNNSANDTMGEILFAHNDSNDAGVSASIVCKAEDAAGNTYLQFNNGKPSALVEHLRITSAGTLESYSPDDTTPNIKWRSNDTNWFGSLNQSVEGGTITSFLSCGGDWSANGTTYSATKALAAYPTSAIAIHNQYNSSWGSQFVFLTKAGGSTTTDGAVTERLRITSDGKVRVPDNGKFTAGAGDDLQLSLIHI